MLKNFSFLKSLKYIDVNYFDNIKNITEVLDPKQIIELYIDHLKEAEQLGLFTNL